mgnify:CR=1 FL=1
MPRLPVLLALALALFGCRGAEAPSPTGPWEVFKGERLVLTVSDGPGPIVSTAAPSPGAPPVRHPFLSASAHAPEEEDALKRILDASETTADFLARLKNAGYGVNPRVH